MAPFSSIRLQPRGISMHLGPLIACSLALDSLMIIHEQLSSSQEAKTRRILQRDIERTIESTVADIHAMISEFKHSYYATADSNLQAQFDHLWRVIYRTRDIRNSFKSQHRQNSWNVMQRCLYLHLKRHSSPLEIDRHVGYMRVAFYFRGSCPLKKLSKNAGSFYYSITLSGKFLCEPVFL